VLTQICNEDPPVTPPPAGDAMPVPTFKEVFSYDPVNLPVISSDPAQARPIGVGPLADGGDTVDVNIQIGPFEGPVNVSFLIYAPSVDSEDLYFISPHYELKSLSQAADENARSQRAEDRGAQLLCNARRLASWKNNVTGVNENLFTVPVAGLPSGIYTLTLIVKSPDDDGNFYRWVTHFTIPKSKDSHDHHEGDEDKEDHEDNED